MGKRRQLAHYSLANIESVCLRVGYYLPKAYSMLVGGVGNLLQGGLSYSTCRIVYYSFQRLLIVGICHETEVCYHVLYLFSLIEAQSAEYLIWHICLSECLLKGSALCVGTVEDGEVAVFRSFFVHHPLYVLAHYHCLFLVAVCHLQLQFLALTVAAVHRFRYLSLVVLYQTVCRLHDILCAAVVLFEFEDTAVLECGLETEHVVYVCSAESIDTLCIVAYGTHSVVYACQLTNNLLLHGIRVLILVYKYILEV